MIKSYKKRYQHLFDTHDWGKDNENIDKFMNPSNYLICLKCGIYVFNCGITSYDFSEITRGKNPTQLTCEEISLKEIID